jgi:hypothetical protein
MDMEAIRSLWRWDTLSAHEREAMARAVGERLPSTFVFAGIYPCALANRRHRIACFEYQPGERHEVGAAGRFALIPGDAVTLGYDPDQPFVPDADQLASWRAFARSWLHNPHFDLHAYLCEFLTPLRRVAITPFLIETSAVPLELLTQIGERFYTHLGPTPTYRTTLATVSAQGFRLPTSDEWEYACSAGARTLWRWGDWCPSTDVPSPQNEAPAWDLHLRPNAFGLQIARYPTEWEFTAVVGRMRGGDGGTCLQTEAFIQWLTLASAFEMRWDEDADADVYEPYLRRVYSIDAALLD